MSEVIPTPEEAARRDAWLADRRNAITSGDVARILGVHRFGGPMDVWLDKKGLAQSESNEAMQWGLRLQRAILEGYADRIGQPIDHADPYLLLRYKPQPILGATLDARWSKGERRCVDAKNIGYFDSRKWGPQGTDEIPESYIIQLHVQMMVTNTARADLAALFTGNHLRVYTVNRDDEICDRIVEAAVTFWREHIEAGFPPDMDGGEAWGKFLNTIKQGRPDLLKSTPEMDAAVERYRLARASVDLAEQMMERAEQEVKGYIADAAGVEGTWGRITWKAPRPSKRTNWSPVAAVFKEQLLKLHPEFEPFIDAIIEKNTQEVASSRRFLVTLNEEDTPEE